jgi:hypothetical protein
MSIESFPFELNTHDKVNFSKRDNQGENHPRAGTVRMKREKGDRGGDFRFICSKEI